MAKPAFASVVLIALLALLLSNGATRVNAAQWEYRKAVDGERKDGKKKHPIPPDWKIAVQSLLTMMAGDKEFKHGLKEEILRVGSGTMDYCNFNCVVCNEDGEMTELEFSDVKGFVAFSSVTETVTAIRFKGGVLTQAPDLRSLPKTVKSISFFGTRFKPDSADDTKPYYARLHLPLKTSDIQSVTCSNCNLKEVRVVDDSVPPIRRLDVSDNPHLDQVPVDAFGALQHLNISGCTMIGQRTTTIQKWVKLLPPTVQSLDASGVGFGGALPEVSFPPQLSHLILANNSISSDGFPVDVFPTSLTLLDLSKNDISGKVPALKRLKKLLTLRLSYNGITQMDWEDVPPHLEVLFLDHNKISGKLVIPPNLEELSVAFNDMSGTVDLEALPPHMTYFDIQSNKFSGEVNFQRLSDAIRFVYLQNNRFTGRCDLTDLPVDLRRLLVGGNKWHNPLPPR